MVSVSKTIANKIQEKRSDLTSDEVILINFSYYFKLFFFVFIYRQFVFDHIYSVLVLIIQ